MRSREPPAVPVGSAEWRRVLGEEYVRALQQLSRAWRVMRGGDQRMWNGFFAECRLPVVRDKSAAREALLLNVLHWRANYLNVAAWWIAVCAVRAPFRAFWLALVLLGCFHALVVRRGVLHVRLPNGAAPGWPERPYPLRQQPL